VVSIGVLQIGGPTLVSAACYLPITRQLLATHLDPDSGEKYNVVARRMDAVFAQVYSDGSSQSEKHGVAWGYCYIPQCSIQIYVLIRK
jgi:hypothetical protein